MTKKEQKQQAHSWAWPVRVVVGVLAGVMAFGIAKYFLSHSSTQRYSQPVQIYNHQPVTSDAGSSSGLESRITLEQARRDSSLRQIYIDQIAAGISLPYLEGIVYDHDGSKLLEQTYQDLIKQGVDQQVITFIMTQRKQQLGDGSYAAMTPHPHFTRGRKESSTIFMGRRIFEGNAHEIEEDVIATVYHESRHAVQS
ncbi:hypothetical protein HYY69_07535, partial [Candidatus Woesearchaeota archaeon]|nr:hypothetical protein [Candidatus Woesearchaeota archaeon]